MLREPKSKYVNKRSNTLLKVKMFYDAEARVVSHEPGKVRTRELRAVTAAGGHLLTCRRPQGKYAGLVGALECVMENGKTKFSVGSGLTDERRANPPPVRRRSLPPPPPRQSHLPRSRSRSCHTARRRHCPCRPPNNALTTRSLESLSQVGSVVTYRFQELTKAGIPRFPTFVGERFDVEGPKDAVLARRAE